MTNMSVRSRKAIRRKTRNVARKTVVLRGYGKESTGYTAAWYRTNGIFDEEIRYSRIYRVYCVLSWCQPLDVKQTVLWGWCCSTAL